MGVFGDFPIFEYPLLSQERVKLRTSNFVRMHILSIDRNKSPLHISGKV